MQTVLLEKKAGVATITLNRPKVHNAISLELVDELQQTLLDCQKDEDIKVMIVTGNGRSFVSGGDLTQFIAARGHEQAFPILNKVARLLTAVNESTKPIIAMINGPAIGGGCEFASACHFRFAREDAFLGFVQIGMHITTGWGGASRLLDMLPESKALSFLLTGGRITAQEAKQYGLVDEVYPADLLGEEVVRFAERIAAQPLSGIEAYMRILQWKRSGMSLAERVHREVDQCAGLWGSDAHVQVVEKFLHKQ